MAEGTIGIIGLGAMGEPMAARLVDAGHSVVSSANRSRKAFERLAPKGLREVASPFEVGRESDLLLSIVFDESQTDRVLRGPEGALAAMKPGGVVLIMSTLSPKYCQELAKEADGQGIAVLDCPLSGAVSGARDGTLTMMLGGPEEALGDVRDALDVLGTVRHCGNVGMGQVVKLANNAMALVTYSLLTEVRDLVRAEGMEQDVFLSILNESTGRSFVSERVPLPEMRRPLGPMPRKDLSFCLEVAKEAGIEMPVVARCLEAGTEEG